MLPMDLRSTRSCPNMYNAPGTSPGIAAPPWVGNLRATHHIELGLDASHASSATGSASDPLINVSERFHRQLAVVKGTPAPGQHTTFPDEQAALLKRDAHAASSPLCAARGPESILYPGQEPSWRTRAAIPGRGRRLADAIRAALTNDDTVMTGKRARQLANILSVVARTGTIVALTTFLRQLIGFAVETHFQKMGAASSMLPRTLVGMTTMLLGPGLNLAGCVRDERNGSATAASRASRIAMMGLSVAGIIAAVEYFPANGICSMMGSFGVQTVFYTLGRDAIQLFFPMHDNGGYDTQGLLFCSLLYGIAQFILGGCMERFAPHSGAGFAMAEADRIARLKANLIYAASAGAAAIRPHRIDDLLRAAFNALTELLDDLLRPRLMWLFGSDLPNAPPRPNDRRLHQAIPSSQADLRIGLSTPRIGRGRWPSADEVAEQFLTTNAMRTSLFILTVIAGAAAAALSHHDTARSERVLMENLVVAGVMVITYPAFIGAHVKKRRPNPPKPLCPAGKL